jgi:hypothetical protein
VKQMRQIRSPVIALLRDFDFVVEALDKSAAQTASEVIRDLIHPLPDGGQESVKAREPSLPGFFIHTFSAALTGVSGSTFFDDPRETFVHIDTNITHERAQELRHLRMSF